MELSGEEIYLNYSNIIKQIEDQKEKLKLDYPIKLISVSKTHPSSTILASYKQGIRIFGESYAQEFRDKMIDFSILSKDDFDPEWHFIGHLQTNKIKYIIEKVDVIHSVDSFKLASEIDKLAKKFNRKVKILVQVNTSGESSKFGLNSNEIIELCKSILTLENIEILGLMTIAGLGGNIDQTRNEFRMLKNLLAEINQSLNLNLKELSMGMSGDYLTAIEEGATMIRIGTAIFGERDYN